MDIENLDGTYQLISEDCSYHIVEICTSVFIQPHGSSVWNRENIVASVRLVQVSIVMPYAYNIMTYYVIQLLSIIK